MRGIWQGPRKSSHPKSGPAEGVLRRQGSLSRGGIWQGPRKSSHPKSGEPAEGVLRQQGAFRAGHLAGASKIILTQNRVSRRRGCCGSRGPFARGIWQRPRIILTQNRVSRRRGCCGSRGPFARGIWQGPRKSPHSKIGGAGAGHLAGASKIILTQNRVSRRRGCCGSRGPFARGIWQGPRKSPHSKSGGPARSTVRVSLSAFAKTWGEKVGGGIVRKCFVNQGEPPINQQRSRMDAVSGFGRASIDDLMLYDDARGQVTAPTRFPVHRRGELEKFLGDLGFLFVVAMRVRWQRREHPPHTRGYDLYGGGDVVRGHMAGQKKRATCGEAP